MDDAPEKGSFDFIDSLHNKAATSQVVDNEKERDVWMDISDALNNLVSKYVRC